MIASKSTFVAPTFPTVSCSGDAHAVGVAHGSQAADKIKSNVEAYRSIFQDMAKLSWDQSLALAEGFRVSCQKLCPELLKEMEGIAEGAGVPLLHVVALNCRSEIALTAPMDGCTAFAWNYEGKQWLTQNWDWRHSVLDGLIVLDIASHGKRPAMKFVTEAGIIGKIGMNEHGVGLTLNAIKTTSLDLSLLPLHLFMRTMLEQPSLASCRSVISSLPGIASAGHVLLVDPTGAVGVESSPVGFAFLEPDAHGNVFHTNHLVNKDLEARAGSIDLWPDSRPRLELVEKRVRATTGGPTPEVIREILSDRSLGECGILRHNGDDGVGADTLFNIAIDSAGRRAEVKCGKTDGEGAIIKLSF
ncbi:acyl-coenzyme A:6-aminopenicillanic acid acyl-transferase-domain-containing protein [Pseudohyphozyma bogoriensis]|nr:acyl-coenzyme A:6-aminopenicillanic acid acyl-transferase-domain-containing protein [Pseudohyphozyma bogoriensis]